MTTPTAHDVPQIVFPGQAAAPPGPVDLLPMYLMHHAFRRDLTRFASAAARTPVEDRATWAALHRRWQRFGAVLHAHHGGEDAVIWPMLRAKVDASDDQAARTTLDEMQAEHAEIDPLLTGCAAGLAAMTTDGDAAARADLAGRMRAAADRLGQHLAHEERAAMTLVQRYLTPAEWKTLDQAVSKHYSNSLVPFMLGWLLTGVPRELLPRVRGFLGLPFFTLARYVFGPGFARRERIAFAHAVP